MRDISVSEYISKSVAAEYIASATMGNPNFESRSICGYKVDYVDIDSKHKEHYSERLARVMSCNDARTIVACAYVSPKDN